MIKRIFLFLVTNVLVMLTISLVTSLLGVRGWMTQYGIDYQSLMIYCAIWGMGGAFISLALSRVMAKWMMRVQVIDPQSAGGAERELVSMVHRLAQAAQLPAMPQVGIYESAEVNAFATGPSKSRALVAVSTGLLSRMNRAELEGVLGHEIAHVANGDMVTMTLIQGVVNAFAMFFARIIGYIVANAMRSDDERGPSYMVQMVVTFVCDIAFTILGSIVVAYFSRLREYRADKGGAQFAGRDKMIGALQSLQRSSEMVDTAQPAYAALKINGKRSLAHFFLTHPPLEDRIARLKGYAA